MTVRTGSVEIVVPQAMLPESTSIVFSSETSTVGRDVVGWAGTLFGRRSCIRISGSDRRGRIDVAVTPETGLDEAWRALIEAGFREPLN
jgi:hypothetical protein